MSKLCNKCNSVVSKSDVKGYDYVCFNCDENLYAVEVHNNYDTKTIEQVKAKAKAGNCELNYQTLIYSKGRKFYKLTSKDLNSDMLRGVYCFIDFEGNIYKPANYATPAKGVRGNVQTTDTSKIDQYGSWLYRR